MAKVRRGAPGSNDSILRPRSSLKRKRCSKMSRIIVSRQTCSSAERRAGTLDEFMVHPPGGVVTAESRPGGALSTFIRTCQQAPGKDFCRKIQTGLPALG